MIRDSYRARSLSILAQEGLTVAALPALDRCFLRQDAEVIDRLLCLHACAAAAYGFAKNEALKWAEAQGLMSAFESAELTFLVRGGEAAQFQQHVEAMFALHWALGLERKFDLFASVDAGFVQRLPNLKVGESATLLRNRAQLRPKDEIIQAADTLYCLHWIERNDALSGGRRSLPIQSFIVTERRRAVDWLLSEETWSAISLDT